MREPGAKSAASRPEGPGTRWSPPFARPTGSAGAPTSPSGTSRPLHRGEVRREPTETGRWTEPAARGWTGRTVCAPTERADAFTRGSRARSGRFLARLGSWSGADAEGGEGSGEERRGLLQCCNAAPRREPSPPARPYCNAGVRPRPPRRAKPGRTGPGIPCRSGPPLVPAEPSCTDPPLSRPRFVFLPLLPGPRDVSSRGGTQPPGVPGTSRSPGVFYGEGNRGLILIWLCGPRATTATSRGRPHSLASRCSFARLLDRCEVTGAASLLSRSCSTPASPGGKSPVPVPPFLSALSPPHCPAANSTACPTRDHTRGGHLDTGTRTVGTRSTEDAYEPPERMGRAGASAPPAGTTGVRVRSRLPMKPSRLSGKRNESSGSHSG